MNPETLARISTVSNAVKRPVYSSHSVMLFCSGCATVTLGGGGALEADLPSQPASTLAISSRETKGTMRIMGQFSDTLRSDLVRSKVAIERAASKPCSAAPRTGGAGRCSHIVDYLPICARTDTPIKVGGTRMRTITLEEHFATPEFFDGPARFVKDRAEKIGGRYAQVMDRLCDLDTKRLGEMDAAGIDMQVLSLSAPGVEQMESADAIAMARDTNDYLADAVRKHPTRFAGLAAVPTGAPNQAVEELERRVHQGFKGLVINGHNRGRCLDDQFYWPILESAEALNVPIYLHPTPPPQPVIDISYGGFAPMVTDMLAGGAWGWHIETAVHMIRIICGGVFDRFPKLQFVIGHMGEGLPFFFQRLDIIPMAVTKLKQPILSYLKENVHYTFSGMNFPATFLDLLLELGGVDRIMFSADYPYQSM